MTVTTFATTTTGAATLPRVNLLPPEIAEERVVRRAKVGLGAGVLGCVAVVGLLYTAAHAAKSSAENDLAEANAQRNAVQAQVSKFSGVTATYAQVAARQAMLTQIMGDEIQWSHYLNDLSLTMPEHVWLTSVAITQNTGQAPAATQGGTSTGTVFDPGVATITFSGSALGHDDVAVWLESLARQKGYANPYFTNSVEADLYGQPIVNFQSTVTVTPAAYSGRYSKRMGG